MALPGDQVPQDAAALMRRIDTLEQSVRELRAARSADATTIRGGTLDVRNDAGQVIAQIGQIESIFGGPTSGVRVLRPGGNQAVLFESPGWLALYDSAGQIIVSDDIGTGHGLARPWIPYPITPMFRPNGSASTLGHYSVNVGVLAKWEGNVSIQHPKIMFYGFWGQTSGTNTATYDLRVAGQQIATWNTGNAQEVSWKGPYDVSSYVNSDWQQLEIRITASAGTGEVAIHPLSVYGRQS